MNPNKTIIKPVSFTEFITVTSIQSVNSILDIVIDDEITLEKYCDILINKLLKLPQSQFSNFINNQLEQMKSPISWLESFDLLIAENEKLFIENGVLYKYNKLFNLIEKRRDSIQVTSAKLTKMITPKRFVNADTEDRYFSFHETKLHIETLSSFNDKIIYLTEEIFEYKQADIISKNNKLLDYDFQCTQLIEKLQTLRKMKTDFEKEVIQNKLRYNSSEVKSQPLQINGAINILTNVFKQMMTTVKPNGKPYLGYKIKEITEFICENFVDENGQALSQSTIQTYLSPNRNDKDPNIDNTIKV
ncbi:hypothetical protein KIH23_08455 [Flavobacterium sp. CYK-55]|uniref:hypothetical protein n=1 Tax=Flavobacterium sp. CYK-55 TaxID=2835529 RepID=UPI001BCA7438|nr:hypothetical protein [Flavobacterium sp. CYK-55]MBS7787328.1 hypothetical protein [Flavobacterium sp. CYK-55]